MIFLTHLMFALLLGAILLKNLSLSVNPFAFFGIVLVSSLLPDIDMGTSYLGKYVRPLNYFFSHRGFFHSITFMIILAISVNYITGQSGYAIALMIGFASHVILDSMTPMGVNAFWPSKIRIKGVFKTGGFFDMLLFISFTAMVFLLLYYYGVRDISQLFSMQT